MDCKQRSIVTQLHITLAFTLSGKDTYGEPSLNYRAKFKGDLSQLQKKLSQNLKKWKPIAVADSVLLITGVVEKGGFLGNPVLKSGTPTSFSKKTAGIYWLRSGIMAPCVVE